MLSVVCTAVTSSGVAVRRVAKRVRWRMHSESGNDLSLVHSSTEYFKSNSFVYGLLLDVVRRCCKGVRRCWYWLRLWTKVPLPKIAEASALTTKELDVLILGSLFGRHSAREHNHNTYAWEF